MSGAVLQKHNQVTASGVGIQAGGSVNLEMNFGTITGNVTKDRGP